MSLMNEVIFHGTWFRGEQHKWAYYDAYNGELPSLEILAKVKGIVFPGSRFSVYDDIPWIKGMHEFVRTVHRDFTHIKMIGICFGH